MTPPLQSALSGAAGFEQTPVEVLQVPTVWQTSSAAQTTGLVPVQVPAVHVSVCVQKFPSSHRLPSAAFGLEQVPFVGSQTPATWH
jgi:hypothetical protein